MTTLAVPRPPDRRLRTRNPFARVVLGVDFSPASLAAARWGTTYVAPHADALLAHVAPSTAAAKGGGEREGVTMRLRPADGPGGAITAGLDGFARTLGVASARSLTRAGAPSHWLSTIANDAEASLLVLGRRADANRTRVGEPNVIERSARRTSASVLVVPEGTTEPLAHVLAAIDDSDDAACVLDRARHLAQVHDVPLTIMHVLAPELASYPRVRRASATQMQSRVLAVETAKTPARGGFAGPTARWLPSVARSCELHERDRMLVRMGDPVHEIATTAAAVSSTLVVVGTRGADDAPRGSIGSVARELMTRASVPILAVHRTDTAPLLGA